MLTIAIICLPLQNFAVTVESVANSRQADIHSDFTEAKITNLEAQNNSDAVFTVEITPASQKPRSTNKTQLDNSFNPAVFFGFLIVVFVVLVLLFNKRSRRESHATGSSSFPKNSGGSCDSGDAGGDC